MLVLRYYKSYYETNINRLEADIVTNFNTLDIWNNNDHVISNNSDNANANITIFDNENYSNDEKMEQQKF